MLIIRRSKNDNWDWVGKKNGVRIRSWGREKTGLGTRLVRGDRAAGIMFLKNRKRGLCVLGQLPYNGLKFS